MSIRKSKNTTTTKKRIFYILTDDINKNPPGLILENEKVIAPKGTPNFCLRDTSKRGFPPTAEPPHFKYVKKEGRPPQDFEEFRNFWLVSNRTKRIFEKLDPEAFVFLSCEMEIGDQTTIGEYWLCDIVRVLDALDEDASDIKVENDGKRKLYNLLGATRYCFKEDVIGSSHVFRMDFFWSIVICDEIFQKTCKAEKIKNIRFESTIV